MKKRPSDLSPCCGARFRRVSGMTACAACGAVLQKRFGDLVAGMVRSDGGGYRAAPRREDEEDRSWAAQDRPGRQDTELDF